MGSQQTVQLKKGLSSKLSPRSLDPYAGIYKLAFLGLPVGIPVTLLLSGREMAVLALEVERGQCIQPCEVCGRVGAYGGFPATLRP
jgi:hypothetical protein